MEKFKGSFIIKSIGKFYSNKKVNTEFTFDQRHFLILSTLYLIVYNGAKKEKIGIFLIIPNKIDRNNKVGRTNLGIFFFTLFSNWKR